MDKPSYGSVSVAKTPTELFFADAALWETDALLCVGGIVPSSPHFCRQDRERPAIAPASLQEEILGNYACKLSADIFPDLRSFTNS